MHHILETHALTCVSSLLATLPAVPTNREMVDSLYHVSMFVFQTQMNVTVPSSENCTSPSLCWSDGTYTWTLKNVTYTENIAKCEWSSAEHQPLGWAVGVGVRGC